MRSQRKGRRPPGSSSPSGCRRGRPCASSSRRSTSSRPRRSLRPPEGAHEGLDVLLTRELLLHRARATTSSMTTNCQTGRPTICSAVVPEQLELLPRSRAEWWPWRRTRAPPRLAGGSANTFSKLLALLLSRLRQLVLVGLEDLDHLILRRLCHCAFLSRWCKTRRPYAAAPGQSTAARGRSGHRSRLPRSDDAGLMRLRKDAIDRRAKEE